MVDGPAVRSDALRRPRRRMNIPRRDGRLSQLRERGPRASCHPRPVARGSRLVGVVGSEDRRRPRVRRGHRTRARDRQERRRALVQELGHVGVGEERSRGRGRARRPRPRIDRARQATAGVPAQADGGPRRLDRRHAARGLPGSLRGHRRPSRADVGALITAGADRPDAAADVETRAPPRRRPRGGRSRAGRSAVPSTAGAGTRPDRRPCRSRRSRERRLPGRGHVRRQGQQQIGRDGHGRQGEPAPCSHHLRLRATRHGRGRADEGR